MLTCKHLECDQRATYKSAQLCRKHYIQLYKRKARLPEYKDPDPDVKDFWEYVKKELKIK